MNLVLAKRIAIVLILLIPVGLIADYTGIMLGFAYLRGSNPKILVTDGKSNNFPPIGVVSVDLQFAKPDILDDTYNLFIDLNVGCNQTLSATLAIHKFGQESSDITTWSLTRNVDSGFTEGRGNQTAYFIGWNSSVGFTRHFEEYGAFSFPYDTYKTESIIIALNTSGLDNTHEFDLQECFLNATVPIGFTPTISDFAKLPNNETLSALGSSAYVGNYSAWQFSVLLMRNEQSLLLFSAYLVFPLIGVWSMLSITQFYIQEPKDRIAVFAGALIATFAYIFTFRSVAPPMITWDEVVIVVLMGAWALLEIFRAALSTLMEDSKSILE